MLRILFIYCYAENRTIYQLYSEIICFRMDVFVKVDRGSRFSFDLGTSQRTKTIVQNFPKINNSSPHIRKTLLCIHFRNNPNRCCVCSESNHSVALNNYRPIRKFRYNETKSNLQKQTIIHLTKKEKFITICE